MFKVVWKSFRYNRKNFLSFFTSEILSVTVIFMFIYIQEALSQVPGIKTEALQFAYQSELRKQLRIIIPCIILIMILVTGYSVKAYINTRIRDYKLFQLFIRNTQEKFKSNDWSGICNKRYACMWFWNSVWFNWNENYKRNSSYQNKCKICQRHFDVKSLSCVDSKLSDHDDRRIYYIANIIRYQNEFRR